MPAIPSATKILTTTVIVLVVLFAFSRINLGSKLGLSKAA
jgi:hypothetical protein